MRTVQGRTLNATETQRFLTGGNLNLNRMFFQTFPDTVCRSESVHLSVFWHRPSTHTGQVLRGVPEEIMEAARERTTERPTSTAVDCSLLIVYCTVITWFPVQPHGFKSISANQLHPSRLPVLLVIRSFIFAAQFSRLSDWRGALVQRRFLLVKTPPKTSSNIKGKEPVQALLPVAFTGGIGSA